MAMMDAMNRSATGVVNKLEAVNVVLSHRRLSLYLTPPSSVKLLRAVEKRTEVGMTLSPCERSPD